MESVGFYEVQSILMSISQCLASSSAWKESHPNVINMTFYEFTETRVAHQRQYYFNGSALSFSFYRVSVDVLSRAQKFTEALKRVLFLRI